MTSLRRQLTLRLVIGLAIVLVLGGALLRASLARTLVGEFDKALLARAGSVANVLELVSLGGVDGPDIEYDFQADAMPEFVGGPEPEYFDLWFADGTEYGRSPSLGLENQLAPALPAFTGPHYRDLVLPDGRAGRAIELTVKVAFDEEEFEEIVPDADLPRITCVVARSRELLDTQLAQMTQRLVGFGGLVLAIAILLVSSFVKQGLAPLRQLSDEVAGIDATTLEKRVQSAGVPDELRVPAERLNELLSRLEDSFGKERRMTAAMAHELRTPIAELRSASDVAERWPEDAELSAALTETAHDVALRMSESIESIMRYCRLEAGQDRPEREPVPLKTMLDDLWRPFEQIAGGRGVRFTNEIPEDTTVISDRGLLGIIFGNLLSNAASFASEGEVRAGLNGSGEGLSVRVCNEAAQLEPGDVDRMSEPFWRKDVARTVGRHSGLGLTLVTSVAHVLGCRAVLGLDGGRFSASIGFAEQQGTGPFEAQTAD